MFALRNKVSPVPSQDLSLESTYSFYSDGIFKYFSVACKTDSYEHYDASPQVLNGRVRNRGQCS